MQKKHFPLNPPKNLTIIFENKPDRDRIPYSNDSYERNTGVWGTDVQKKEEPWYY